MNISSKKIKDLLETFVELDDSNQNKLISEAYKLLITQSIKRYLPADSSADEEYIKQKRSESLKTISDFSKMLNSLSDEQKAAFMLKINEITNGQIAQETDISVQLSNRKLSIEEYLSLKFPFVNQEKVKDLYKENLRKRD